MTDISNTEQDFSIQGNNYELARLKDGTWFVAVPAFCDQIDATGAAAFLGTNLYIEKAGKLMICADISSDGLQKIKADNPHELMIAEMSEGKETTYTLLPLKFGDLQQ